MAFIEPKANKQRDDNIIQKVIHFEINGPNLTKNFSIDMSCMDDINCTARPFYLHVPSEEATYFYGKTENLKFDLSTSIFKELYIKTTDKSRLELLQSSALLEFCQKDQYDGSIKDRAILAHKKINEEIKNQMLPLIISRTSYPISIIDKNNTAHTNEAYKLVYEQMKIIEATIDNYKLPFTAALRNIPVNRTHELLQGPIQIIRDTIGKYNLPIRLSVINRDDEKVVCADYLILQPDNSKGYNSLRILTKI